MTDEATTLERLARELARANETLEVAVNDADQELARVRRRHHQGIKRAVDRYVRARGVLLDFVREHQELFRRPRTRVVEGVKVGIRKQKGKLVIENAGRVVERIERRYGSEAEHYLATTVRPLKSALEKLTAQELKALGVRVTEDPDAPVADPVEGDAERMARELIDAGGE